jgi:hypothetical protein
MEQLIRTQRYLRKLRYAYQGIQDSTPLFNPEDVRDDVLSLFMHCYHVKDWIKTSPELSESVKMSVEDYVNENEALKICKDLCNGSKHFKLSRGYRSGSAQELAMTEHDPVTYLTGTGGEKYRVKS